MGKEFQEFAEIDKLYKTGLSAEDPSLAGSVLAIGGFMFDAGDLAKLAVKGVGAGGDVAADALTHAGDDAVSDAVTQTAGDFVPDTAVHAAGDIADDPAAKAIIEKIGDGDMRFGYDGRIRGRTEAEEIGDMGAYSTSAGIPLSGTKPSTDSIEVLELDSNGLPKQLTQDHGASTYKIPPFLTHSEAIAEAGKRSVDDQPHILFVQVEENGVIIAEWYEVSEVLSLWKRAGDTEQKALSRMNLNSKTEVIMWGAIAPCTHAENGCRKAMDIAATQSGAKIEYMVVRKDGKVSRPISFPLPLSSED
jgi:hypothetical protein